MKYCDTVDIMICIAIIACILFLMLVEISEKDGKCAYCQSKISDNADIVCYSDGRRYHVECWREYNDNRGDSNDT